jgi:hypothetical protein
VAGLGALGMVALVALVGCSSSGGGAESSSSTAPVETTSLSTASSAVGSTTSSGVTAPPSSPGGGGLPSSPSTLSPNLSGTCDALAETYGIDQIRPTAGSSWVDERQRVVVDARREAQLLSVARDNAPAAIADDLSVMAEYASFVADAVEGSASYSVAVSTIDAGPDRAGVDTASAVVVSWRNANC